MIARLGRGAMGVSGRCALRVASESRLGQQTRVLAAVGVFFGQVGKEIRLLESGTGDWDGPRPSLGNILCEGFSLHGCLPRCAWL